MKFWAEITAAVNAIGVAKGRPQKSGINGKNLTLAAKREFTNFGKEIDNFNLFKNTPALLPRVDSNPAADQVGNNTNISVF